MITLTRLNGQPFALNPDLIERLDVTPDTVVTLIDGAKYLVAESLDQVVDRIRRFRASVVALANAGEDIETGDTTTTTALPALAASHPLARKLDSLPALRVVSGEEG